MSHPDTPEDRRRRRERRHRQRRAARRPLPPAARPAEPIRWAFFLRCLAGAAVCLGTYVRLTDEGDGPAPPPTPVRWHLGAPGLALLAAFVLLIGGFLASRR